MRHTKWNDLKHKASPEVRERNRQESLAELDRMGFAAVRKARELTQVELAERLGLPQPSISDMERRKDILLSTLARYIEGMGGRIEVQAVFPDASFDLTPVLEEMRSSMPTPPVRQEVVLREGISPGITTVKSSAQRAKAQRVRA